MPQIIRVKQDEARAIALFHHVGTDRDTSGEIAAAAHASTDDD